MSKRKLFFGTIITVAPILALAQAGGITDFISQFNSILNTLAPFIIGLAVFIILYGILGYISSSADEEKRKQAKDFIMWGVIGVFLMLSIWGLVSILVNTFNLDNSRGYLDTAYGPLKNLDDNQPTTIVELIGKLDAAGSHLIPFLIGIGVFIIILGVFNYIRQGDNEEKRAEARMFIIWGVISIFVMLSIWGFVNILVKSFNLDNAVTTSTITPLPPVQ